MRTFHGVTPQHRYLRAAGIGCGVSYADGEEGEDLRDYRKTALALAAYSAESCRLAAIDASNSTKMILLDTDHLSVFSRAHGVLYGRLAIIHFDGEPDVELLEVVCP